MKRLVDAYVRTPAFVRSLDGESLQEENEWQVSTGDLDGDGLIDAAANLTFVVRGGNAQWYMGILVWRNDGRALRLAGKIEVPRNSTGEGKLSLDEIRDSRVVVSEYLFGPDDATCCPSIERQVEYRLIGGRPVRLSGH